MGNNHAWRRCGQIQALPDREPDGLISLPLGEANGTRSDAADAYQGSGELEAGRDEVIAADRDHFVPANQERGRSTG